jgi:hypothetical protein
VDFMPLFSITRNMTVVRQGGELTLLNSIRLSREGEAELERLGKVRHVIKQGPFHGMDDPYVVDRFKATLWALPGAKHPGGLRTERELRSGEHPLGDAELFTFERGLLPEAAFVLPREGGILVNCDAVQNWTDFDGCSLIGKGFLRTFGFRGPARIGPFWRKRQEGKGDRSIEADFRRLLERPFRHLLSAHGEPLKEMAQDALRREVERAWGQR